jgi:hypothetical protein
MRWRQGSTVVAVALLVLGACGGGSSDSDEGADDDVAAEAGDDSGGGGGDGDDSVVGGGDDGGEGGDDGGSPPTAGPGVAGVFTGPSGAEQPPKFPVVGCGDVDSVTRLENLEFEELLHELECIFDHADQLPPRGVEQANEAARLAREGIANREADASTTTTTNGPETTGPEITDPETTDPETTGPTEPTPVVDPEPGTTTSG